MSNASSERADLSRWCRGEQALPDLVALGQWLAREGRHASVDRSVGEWFRFPIDLEETDAGTALRWAPHEELPGRDDPAVVPVVVRDTRRSVEVDNLGSARAYATLRVTGAKYVRMVGWRGPNPWYVGLYLTDSSSSTLFWRGHRDQDVEVEVVATTTSGQSRRIVRTTTGWRLDPPPSVLNQWSAFGGRFINRPSVYRFLHTPPLSTLAELRSDHLDTATITGHLTEARIFPERLVINGEEWALTMAPLARG